MAWISSGTVAYSHLVGALMGTQLNPLTRAAVASAGSPRVPGRRGRSHSRANCASGAVTSAIVDLWRLLGSVAVGVGGLLMVFVAMAQARDTAIPSRRGREGKAARVARSAGIGLAVLTLLMALVLTVLPQFMVWAIALAVWLILITLFLAG